MNPNGNRSQYALPPPADATQCSECEVLAEQLRLAIAACTEADLARRQFMESFFHESPQIATDWTTSEWRKLHERLRGANASQKEIHARWREHLLLECPRRAEVVPVAVSAA